jgi:hypothetical protein
MEGVMVDSSLISAGGLVYNLIGLHLSNGFTTMGEIRQLYDA